MVDLLRAQPHGRIGCIDCGVARTNHSDARGHLGDASALVACDEVQRIRDASKLFARHAELVNRSQPRADEDGIVRALKLRQHRCVDVGVEAELDAETRNHVDLAQALGQRKLVLGDAIGVESAGQWPRVVDGRGDAVAPQFRSARKRRGSGADQGNALPCIRRRA